MGGATCGMAPHSKMESEPTTWRGVIAHWKEGRGQVREASCELFRSCDSIFANVPLRTAVRHADCDRHELVRTIKLCANCDVALAMDRCSYLTELQMGDLHGKVPSCAEDMSRENFLRAVKFVLDHKWTGNPDPGLHCLLSRSL